MYCKKCGCEVTDKKIKKCPQCGARVNGIPAWAVALIVVAVIFTAIPFFLAIVGVVAAMTLPSLIANTDSVRNETAFKKSLATLNQSVLISQALNDGPEYTKFDDVWKHAKEQFVKPVDIENGVRLADGTEIKYRVLNPVCQDSPDDKSDIGEATACAILTIDVNGFDKGPNKGGVDQYSGVSTKHIKDQFEVYLYKNAVDVNPNSFEGLLINRGNY